MLKVPKDVGMRNQVADCFEMSFRGNVKEIGHKGKMKEIT